MFCMGPLTEKDCTDEQESIKHRAVDVGRLDVRERANFYLGKGKR